MTGEADEATETFVSGRAQAVAWQRIEAELSTLWRKAAERDPERVLMRACLWNLLALAPAGHLAMERYRSLVDRVTADVPCRVIGICENESQLELAAYVEANWRTHGSVQNGSDEVLLVGHETLRPRLESLARSLLVPDASVALYVDGRPSLERVRRMAQGIDRLILDSRQLESSADLSTIADLVAQHPNLDVADLAWLGIGPLRSVVASLFDRTDAAAELRAITRIEVTAGVPGLAPRALLFLGWLGSRLGFSLPERLPTRSDGVHRWRTSAPDGRSITLALDRQVVRGHGVVAVELAAGERCWHIRREEPGLYISAPGTPDRVQPTRRHADPDLVIAALGTRGADRLYRPALAWAAALNEGA